MLFLAPICHSNSVFVCFFLIVSNVKWTIESTVNYGLNNSITRSEGNTTVPTNASRIGTEYPPQKHVNSTQNPGFSVSPRRNSIHLKRIANETKLTIRDAPWTVAVMRQMRESKGLELLCSGGLISPDWVLSAARCVVDEGVNDIVMVQAGVDKVSAWQEIQMRLVIYWHINPCYKDLNAFDIALLKVASNFEISETVKPVPLDGAGWPSTTMYSRKCLTSGWESTNYKTQGYDILRTTNIVARHGDKGCPCGMKQNQKRFICDTIGDKERCYGDLGGLLVCDNKAVGIGHKLMLTSCKDATSEDCGISALITSYIFLCPYLDWIKTHVSIAPSKPLSCGSWKTIAERLIILFFPVVIACFELLVT